ncbi:hypothetical protein CYMTET_36011, partial [Cymbomonas tetramitiformis]
ETAQRPPADTFSPQATAQRPPADTFSPQATREVPAAAAAASACSDALDGDKDILAVRTAETMVPTTGSRTLLQVQSVTATQTDSASRVDLRLIPSFLHAAWLQRDRQSRSRMILLYGSTIEN